jgi:hypothetical protein
MRGYLITAACVLARVLASFHTVAAYTVAFLPSLRCLFPFQGGVLPFGEAILCITAGIIALCLNKNGLELVRRSRVIDTFIPILISKK